MVIQNIEINPRLQLLNLNDGKEINLHEMETKIRHSNIQRHNAPKNICKIIHIETYC